MYLEQGLRFDTCKKKEEEKIALTNAGDGLDVKVCFVGRCFPVSRLEIRVDDVTHILMGGVHPTAFCLSVLIIGGQVLYTGQYHTGRAAFDVAPIESSLASFSGNRCPQLVLHKVEFGDSCP